MTCAACVEFGRRAHATSGLITVEEVTPQLVADLRTYVVEARAVSETRARPLTRNNFVTFISDLYRDLDAIIVDWRGCEAFIDFECLEGPSLPYWVRDFLFTPRSIALRQRLKMLTRPRVAAIASILKAADPHAGALWGLAPANDRGAAPTLPVPIGQAVLAWMDRPCWSYVSEGAGEADLEDEMPF